MQYSTPSRYILYHAQCTDGFAAAFAAYLKFGEQQTVYIPLARGEAAPALPAGAHVYLLDICLPREELLALESRVKSLLVLDHHITDQQACGDLDCCIFNIERSAAVLAWYLFHPDTEPPTIYSYIEDADLERYALPHSHEVNAAIRTIAQQWNGWKAMLGLDISLLSDYGTPVVQYQRTTVQRICLNAQRMLIGGHEVPVVNTPAYIGEVCAELLKLVPEAPFSACYYDRGDGQYVWSLRSRGDFDVAAIAEQYGGGGHANSAGYRTQIGA